MEAHKLEQDEMQARLAFMAMDEAASAALVNTRPSIERHIGKALERFYTSVRARPELRAFFDNDSHMERARKLQASHWLTIANGRFDETYYHTVRAIGDTHARIGLEPKWYVGGYALVLENLLRGAIEDHRPARRGLGWNSVEKITMADRVSAMVKAAMLDMELSISTYLEKLADERRLIDEHHRHALDRLSESLERVAEGELSVSVNADEFASNTRLALAFNLAVSNLREIISETRTAAGGIRTGSGEIAQASDDLARRTEQQAGSLEGISASINALTDAVHATAEMARKTDQTVVGALRNAKTGGDVVRETQEAMSQIASSSKQMGQIIGVIDEIAFQTNLLALNAGVEAARAGDAGKGFAVVASEVRTLAQRSAEAAKTIKSLISSSSGYVNTGVSLVEKTSEVLIGTIEAFGEVNRMVSNMSEASDNQADSIAKINSAINGLDQMTQQNAAMVEQTSAAGASLATEADSLATLVQRFRLGD